MNQTCFVSRCRNKTDDWLSFEKLKTGLSQSNIQIRPANAGAIRLSSVIDGTEMTDEELMREIQRGHSALLDVIVRRHSDRIFGLLMRMSGSRETAEEVLQNMWILFIRKLHQFDCSRTFSPWLTKIAVNSLRDYWRRQRLKRLVPWFDRSPVPCDTSDSHLSTCHENDEYEMDVKTALEKLSAKLREIVVLKFYSGMTQDEIASVLEIPVGTVKSRLNFALLKLKNIFKEQEVSG
ncbi:RNA polymerase sigma factor [bacterium]|nr:RNA polymerase sigma factor [candidate division CSSED10-310 bacterium]